MEGGCSCGAVRYVLTAAPAIVHCCHCRQCQRETGASFALNSLVEGEHVELLGEEPEPVETATRSGKGQTIWRCPHCRVAVWSNYNGVGPDVYFIRSGTLLDPDVITPDTHIYASSKQPWVVLPEGAAQFETFYTCKDIVELMGEEKARRIMALFGR